MINKVVLVGRMTRDPELRKTNSGKTVVSFSLALNRIGAKDGEQQADYPNCVVWNKAAENVAKYCTKGSLVGVEGSLRTRTYDDANGKKVFVTEVLCNSVQFLETKKKEASQGQTQPQAQVQAQPTEVPDDVASLDEEFGNSFDVMEDDIQF